MKFFSEKIDIEYDQILTKPTLKGENWLGNSQQGINSGVKSKS